MSETQSTTDRIRAAIKAANHAVTGVAFEPFRLKVEPPASFQEVWTALFPWIAQNVTFYAYKGGAADAYRPLGDICVAGAGGGGPFAVKAQVPMTDGVLVVAPGDSDPDALRHPLDFTFVLNDHGSRNPQDISYWRMQPPDGYSALGICFGAAKPDPANYWCVKTEYLASVSTTEVWTDAGTRIAADGNIERPAFAGAMGSPDGQILILPQTVLSHQDLANEPAWALCCQQAFLDIPEADPPDPQPVASVTSGSTTTTGLSKVAILPFTAVADANFPDQWQGSPFYYVAAQPYWACVWSESMPAGGSETFTLTVGVDQSHSTTFEESTSLTVSAETGCYLDGISAQVSVSYTQSFSLTTSTTTNNSTQTSDQLSITVPQAARAWLHQRHVKISVFRTNLSELSSIDYACQDHLLLTPADTQPEPA